MPTYVFECSKCDGWFEDLCGFDERKKVRCPLCGKKPKQLMTAPGAVIFTNPKGTSKEDNFDYVAKTNYEHNLQLRAAAEKANKGGMPYRNIDDSKYDGKIV